MSWNFNINPERELVEWLKWESTCLGSLATSVRPWFQAPVLPKTKGCFAGYWWFTPVILATQQIVHETLSWKNHQTHTQKGAGGVAQCVGWIQTPVLKTKQNKTKNQRGQERCSQRKLTFYTYCLLLSLEILLNWKRSMFPLVRECSISVCSVF
jgi:hypothetical protein